jgi:hypothetical protein
MSPVGVLVRLGMEVMNDNFIELPMSLCQTSAIKPVVEAAKHNRRGVIFITCAPDIPGPWRMQAVALSQKAVGRITRIIKDEMEAA